MTSHVSTTSWKRSTASALSSLRRARGERSTGWPTMNVGWISVGRAVRL